LEKRNKNPDLKNSQTTPEIQERQKIDNSNMATTKTQCKLRLHTRISGIPSWLEPCTLLASHHEGLCHTPKCPFVFLNYKAKTDHVFQPLAASFSNQTNPQAESHPTRSQPNANPNIHIPLVTQNPRPVLLRTPPVLQLVKQREDIQES
jgi:hypothetical protein